MTKDAAAYLARYDEKGGLELLKQGIKLGSGQPMNAAMSLSQSFYSPTLNRFFEDELQWEDDPEAVSWAAYALFFGRSAIKNRG